MEWFVVSVAVAAALFSGWQAWEARRSRKEAKRFATDAEGHEVRATEASERIAAAIELQLEMERLERETYRNPWVIEALPVQSGRRWRFRLSGSEILTDVRIVIPEKFVDERFDLSQPEGGAMRPGEAMTLSWWRSMGSPRQITIDIFWTRPDGEVHNSAMTLD